MLCHVSVQCYLKDRATDPISVALIDRQVALFSDFNRLFEFLGRGFAPYGRNAFYLVE